MARYIFITGGVVSSLGKGLASAALGALLQARGYKVRLRKLDPYLNLDPGTMSPYQHGEVFVTDDGAETDLDLGHYERFIDENLTRLSNVTTGQIYSAARFRWCRTSPTKSKSASSASLARPMPRSSSPRSAAPSATSSVSHSSKRSARSIASSSGIAPCSCISRCCRTLARLVS